MYKIRIAIFLIALFVMGIVLTFSGVTNLIKMNGDVKDFNYDSMQDIQEGDFVQGYVTCVLDTYASTTTVETKYGIETNSYTSAEYFVLQLLNDEDWNDDLYITIVAEDKADRDLLYDICDATWEYYDGNENVTFPEMGIIAKVTKLDSEYEDFFVEWFMYDPPLYSSKAEARSHIIPYALEIYNPNSAYISLCIGLVIVVLFVVVGLIIYNKYKASRTPYSAPIAAASNDEFTIESKPSESGFGESYTPPQPVPIPDIPQPVQPDEFFAVKHKNVAAPAESVEETPKEEPVVATEMTGEMSGLDTTGLFDDADYEIDNASDESEFIE